MDEKERLRIVIIQGLANNRLDAIQVLAHLSVGSKDIVVGRAVMEFGKTHPGHVIQRINTDCVKQELLEEGLVAIKAEK